MLTIACFGHVLEQPVLEDMSGGTGNLCYSNAEEVEFCSKCVGVGRG